MGTSDSAIVGPEHSPLPWKIVRTGRPYADWIVAADGSCVAGLFGAADERLLAAAPLLLAACELALAQTDPALPVHADIAAAVAAARGGAPSNPKRLPD